MSSVVSVKGRDTTRNNREEGLVFSDEGVECLSPHSHCVLPFYVATDGISDVGLNLGNISPVQMSEN